MAISKQEARSYISEDEKSEIDLLERRVDRMLRDGGPLTFDVRIFSNLGGRGIGELFKRYKVAGWKIEYVSDWRDGDYYEFK